LRVVELGELEGFALGAAEAVEANFEEFAFEVD
jgi:hypothetical protein